MFALKLKFILLPQLIAILITMHVHCLHWLMWTGLLSLNAFCRPCKSTTGEMAPKEGTKLAVGTWYGSHCQCTSLYIGFVVEYWPFVGACTRHSYSKLYSLCLLSSLIKLLPPPTPPLRPSCPPPNIHWPNINNECH